MIMVAAALDYYGIMIDQQNAAESCRMLIEFHLFLPLDSITQVNNVRRMCAVRIITSKNQPSTHHKVNNSSPLSLEQQSSRNITVDIPPI